MAARRNPDGDSPLCRQWLNRASCAVRRKLAPRGEPVAPPEQPYLVVPVLGQSNAFGMGRRPIRLFTIEQSAQVSYEAATQ